MGLRLNGKAKIKFLNFYRISKGKKEKKGKRRHVSTGVTDRGARASITRGYGWAFFLESRLWDYWKK
jgi:hypothetical protein